MSPSSPIPFLMSDNADINEFERYGYALLKPSDIAALLDIPAESVEQFCFDLKEGSSENARLYRKGIARAKMELHENVVRLAVKGSPAAQPLADSFLRDL